LPERRWYQQLPKFHNHVLQLRQLQWKATISANGEPFGRENIIMLLWRFENRILFGQLSKS
jgi:hypothetical protein